MAARPKDPYATLGVARDADAETIKKAYRKLAQQFHPDVNKDDAGAEDRFKQVSAAYSVLSDPGRRRSYDEFGDIAFDPNFDADKARQARSGFGRGGFSGGGFGGGGFGGGGPEFNTQDMGGMGGIFEEFFGGAAARGGPRAPRQQRGGDLEAALELDFIESALGCEKRITVSRPGEDNLPTQESLTVKIPPGVAPGGRIRLSGKGRPGLGGGSPGDLYCVVSVRPHRFFRREGRDIQLEVPISFAEAVGGAEVEIPTLEGRATVQVPPGTDGGSKLRLRGKGIPAAIGTAGTASTAKEKKEQRGDLYVTLRIRVPKGLDDDARNRLAELLPSDGDSLRAELLQ
ncbi:MAG: DnaJ domain-containing protein [Deltaproteobacteria bacterium]|nr:DnaJ domain-containing protein [Deltaproteobacteria bacterium]